MIDAQLPPALADALRELGHAATHVVELGLQTANDDAVWNAAKSRSAVLVTKDRDFSILRTANEDGPEILWIRIGNTDNRTLINRLIRELPAIVAAFQRGDPVVEFTGR